jgi:NAD(P)H dehydrogenase (quinone)
MGKVLVLYHSASGNTAKMADLVAEGAKWIPGSEVRVREVFAAAPEDIYGSSGKSALFTHPTKANSVS